MCVQATATTVLAQAPYPNRPIKLVSPIPPGGAPDLIARAIGYKLSQGLNQSVVIDTKVGSNGNIAAEFVARAPADGYTLLVGMDSLFVINPYLYPRGAVDVNKELIPIASLGSNQFVLSVNASLPVKTLPELVAYVKKTSPPPAYASGGNGSQHHLAMELFKQRTGINLTHIPYTGGGAATATALLAGDISATIGGSAVSVQVKAGKLRSLATTAATRSPDAPDLPTIAETLPGYEILTWVGLFAATGTSTDALSRLRGEMSRFLVQQDVIDKLNSAGGFLPWNVSVDEFQASIKRDYNRYGEIVKAVGVRVD